MVIDPVSSSGLAIGELARLHLAYQDCSCVDKALNYKRSRIAGWVETIKCTISVAGFDTGNVVDVFYTCSDTR